MHYIKLVGRSILFLAALALYIVNRIERPGEEFINITDTHWILKFVWIIFVLEMLLRFVPSPLESMGCQKQFKKNYIQTKHSASAAQLTSAKRIWAVAAAWFALNGVIGMLYFTGIIDRGILFLISLIYSICDMICILFFCPFQTWFMKNRCCGTCRIYNWDFAMMFTPLLFIPSLYTWGLLGLALILLLRWEVTAHVHPEYFSPATNQSLSCSNCQEKLCQHKTQLRNFIKKNHLNIKERLAE